MNEDEGGLDIPKEMKIRQLALMATRLIRVFEDTWNTYLDLFELMDLEDAKTNTRALEAICELEEELSQVLFLIREQKKVMKYLDEPPPTDIVEDFEQSVLTTLANLDTVYLENYRRKETNE